jgi:galactonate dehydratase
LSAAGQALWDLKAKSYAMPLYKLYGGEKRPVELYANLNNALRRQNKRSAQDLLRNGLEAVAQGFRIVKATPFDEVVPLSGRSGLDAGLDRLHDLASEIPIGRIAIDCHQRFDQSAAAGMVEKLLDRYGTPYWIEEPFDWDIKKSLEYLIRQYPVICWAGAENALNIGEIYEIMKAGYYEIIMPDVRIMCGPSAIKTLIPFAEAVHVKISLHNPAGPIATAHSAHLSSLCRCPLPLEFPYAAIADRPGFTTPREPVNEGKYHLSDLPGIGVEPSPDALKGARIMRNGIWESV